MTKSGKPQYKLDRCEGISKGTILLIHNFGGSAHSLRFLKDFYLGQDFDVLRSDLAMHGTRRFRIRIPIRPQWIEECADLLAFAQSVQRGSQLGVHVQSSLCSELISLIAKKPELREEINFIIFENGPFKTAKESIHRILQYHYRIKARSLRLFLTSVLAALWQPHAQAQFEADLKLLSDLKRKPIKSFFIICEKDRIMPAAEIQAVAAQLPASKIGRIPDAGHLQGLKLFPAVYSQIIQGFMKSLPPQSCRGDQK